jgi:hypothetical protein
MAKYRRKKLSLTEKGYLVAATRRSTPLHLGAGASNHDLAPKLGGRFRLLAAGVESEGNLAEAGPPTGVAGAATTVAEHAGHGCGRGEAWRGASDAARMRKRKN